MKLIFTYCLIVVCFLTSYFSFSQVSIFPKLVTDGPITKMEYSPNLGLIVAGNFKYVGYPAKNVAIVDDNAGNPSGQFPFLSVTNNVTGREVIPDGIGGWYVVTNSKLYSNGSFARRPQQIWGDSTGRLRIFDCITHLNADNSVDSLFKINANTATYRIVNIQRVVLYKSRLYAWCDLADQGGSLYRRQLLGINARTGAVEWNPQTGHRLDVETGDLSVLGRTLFVVGRMNVVNGQPATRYSLSYNLDTHQLTNWNPLNTVDLECGNCAVSSLKGQGSRLVMTAAISPNANQEFIAVDTMSNLLWRQRPEGFSGSNLVIDNTVGYYLSNYYGGNIIKIRLTDGQTVGKHVYSEYRQTSDTSKLYVGDVRGFSLQGKHLYIYGTTNDGSTVRRSAVQVDTATFNPTDWKPFNERESGEAEQSGKYRTVETLAFQGNKVFIAGDFSLIKIQFAPNLAAINPITNTLRWRPRVGNLQQENYFQQIEAIAADGDSLIWLYHIGTMRALDARTGFVLKRFELNTSGSPVTIKQIIPASDRLYLQGQFQQIRGIAGTSGFAAITKDGGVFPWEPLFTSGTGQVNKAAIQGDHIYLAGRFTTFSGKKNLAMINRFTGHETSWKTEVANSIYGYEYEVKDFSLQGGELFTVGQDRGYTTPGEYRKVSLSSGKVTATYSYTTCQASEQLFAKDRYVFINERYCTPYERENVSYFDQGSKKFNNRPILAKYNILSPVDNQSRSYLPSPNVITFVGSKLYYANYYGDDPYGTILPIPPLMTLNFPKGFFAETVEYFPKSGGNAGMVSVNFYGTNLAVGSKVKLTRVGQTPISVFDSLLTFPELSRMQAVFDLRGIAVGNWNVEIKLPSGENIVVPNGFTVSQAKPADIQVMLNAPAAYRPGGPIRMTISVANRGDMDAYGVPITTVVNTDASLKIRTQSTGNGIEDAMQFEVTEMNGKAYSGNGNWLILNKLNAGQIYTFQAVAQSSSGNPVEVNVSSGRPYNDLEINPDDYGNFPEHAKKVRDCLEPIAKQLIPDLIREAVGIGLNLESGFVKDLVHNFFKDNYLKPEIGISDGLGSVNKTFKGTITEAGIEQTTGSKAVASGISKGLGFKDSFDAIKKACDPLRPEPTKQYPRATIPAIQSRDPNDKIGPTGTKPQRFVGGKDNFNYVIRFENYASANANAQIVRVIDTLDRTKYSYSTFQLGYFNVADTTFYAPPGRKQHSVDWDLRPTKNLVLRMEARFNDTTGILTSTYKALDPVTMELTEDVFAGFLPPNRNAPEGEGSLAFSIRVKDELQNLTQVKNTAHIYFDYNAPIPTPVWKNTLDKGLPQSSMNPLPAVSHSTTITLGWKGADAESGPKLHDIYMSINGNDYQRLLTATYDSTFQFVGKADSTYRFYSVAYDGVYNQELVPPTFDAQTTIRITSGIVESLRSGNWNDPATWSCNCIPTASNDVVIKAGHTILLDSTMAEAVCQNLEILGTFSMQGSSITVNGVSIVIDQNDVITR